jgi:hypothetical protein
MKVRTLDVSLYMDWAEGKITLEEAASMFYDAGWCACPDVEATRRVFARVKQEEQDQLW